MTSRGMRTRIIRSGDIIVPSVYLARLLFVHPGRAWRCIVLLLILGAVSPSCTTAGPPERDALYHELREEFLRSAAHSGETREIRAYYREIMGPLPGEGRHEVVALTSLDEEMIVHLFHPWSADSRKTPSGTVLVLHGYLSYPAEMGALIRAMVARGYVVVAPALPGHGLSGGEPAGIGDFSHYGVFVRDVVETLGERMPKPWHALGHSTGATALYEYIRLAVPEEDPFERIVFLAPLVRSAWYRLSLVGRTLTRPFISRISSGADSPLIPAVMPLSWFDAQVEWNRRSRSFPPIERPVLVLQGDADSVVAWRSNRRHLERLLPALRYELIEGGEHVLHGSDPDVRRRTFHLIESYLGDEPTRDLQP